MKFPGLALAAALMLPCANAAFAQDPAPQVPPQQAPNRTLAMGPNSPQGHHDWTLAFSGFGGYERSQYEFPVSAPENEPQTDTENLNSPAGGGSVSGSWSKSGRKSSISFGGSGNSVYYRTVGHAWTDGSAYASQSLQVGRHSTLSAGESYSYAPYYSVGLFTGLTTFSGTQLSAPYTPNADGAIDQSPVQRVGITAQFAHPFTDRTSFSASYSTQYFLSNGGLANSAYRDVMARFSHTVTKAFGYHLGYGYTTIRFPDEPQTTPAPAFHNIDVGADLHKSLSLSRRTTFSFSTGSAILTTTDTGNPTETARTDFRLLASADLDHYIGRSWTARVSYRRDWQILEGTTIPFFTDAVSAGISGSIHPRVSTGLWTSYLIGTLYSAASGQRDNALLGNGWIQFSVRRGLSTYAQLAYYRHRFESQGASLNLPSKYDRNAVRVGLTWTLPSR